MFYSQLNPESTHFRATTVIQKPLTQHQNPSRLSTLIYQLKCGQILNQLKNDIVNWTSTQLRMWNEVATLFLFAIVFIVVVGRVSLTDWYWGVLGLIVFGILMMMIVKLYKKNREKNKGNIPSI